MAEDPIVAQMRERDMRMPLGRLLDLLDEAAQVIDNGHVAASETLKCVYREVIEEAILRLRLADQLASRADLRALVERSIPLLRSFRTLDCGAHYCRYCPAGSHNTWAHSPSCPYEESVVQYRESRELADELEAALRGSPAAAPKEP